MYATHDSIKEVSCLICGEPVLYYDLTPHGLCEYCAEGL